MAQRVEVHLEDDLDGGPAEHTMTFALDGKDYEIDLSTDNAEKLREALRPCAAAGRKTTRHGGGTRSTGNRATKGGDPDTAKIRAGQALDQHPLTVANTPTQDRAAYGAEYKRVSSPATTCEMTGQSGVPYPPEAYAPDGTLWWRLETHPGKRTRYGDELKLMAWLTFNKHVGDTATMPELRAALGDEVVPNSAEHLNRRLRALRPRDGWIIFSKNDDGNLPVGVYRIERKG